MKRTTHIRLLLAGSLACIPFAGCDYQDTPAQSQTLSADNTYTNNYYVHGYGYYHAPYRSWFPHPFNYYDPIRGYYHGGNWTSEPLSGKESSSKPNANVVSHINSSTRSTSKSSGSSISRGGFGHSSSHSFS